MDGDPVTRGVSAISRVGEQIAYANVDGRPC